MSNGIDFLLFFTRFVSLIVTISGRRRRRFHRVGAKVVPAKVLEIIVLGNFIELPRAREARLLITDEA